MNLSCKIVEDLLPLYEDGVCSRESAEAVEAHLRECESCKRLLAGTRDIPLPPEPPASDRTARSFRKLRRRWLSSLVAAALLVPLCILGWGQIQGTGVHFTNLHELYIGSAFVHHLERGSYEKAYGYMDIEDLKSDWQEQWFDGETLSSIGSDGLAQFIGCASGVEDAGGIQDARYVGIDKNGDSYLLYYSVQLGDAEHLLQLAVTDGGVTHFSCEGSFLTDPLAHFAMWSEYLWQQYEGCYYDSESGSYVYFD